MGDAISHIKTIKLNHGYYSYNDILMNKDNNSNKKNNKHINKKVSNNSK
jgi:hypothetical protein